MPRYPAISHIFPILAAALVVLGTLAATTRPADATVRPAAHLACPMAPVAGQWASLRVVLPPGKTGPITVSLRDARGGPTFVRQVSSQHASVLMPLPFLQPNTLLAGAWPVQLTIRTATGKIAQRTIVVARPPHGPAIIAVATLPQTRRWLAQLGPRFAPAVLVAMRISRHELRHSPALALASCRYVLLGEPLAQSLSLRRALGFLSAGIRLICHGPTPPTALKSLSWVSLGNHHDFWVTADGGYLQWRPAPIVVWRLDQMRFPRIATPPPWKMVLWSFIPVGLLLIGLTRLATHRAFIGLPVLVVMILAFSLGIIWWLTPTLPQFLVTCRWSTQAPPGTLAMHQQFYLAGSPRGQQLHLKIQGPLPPLPLVATARQWLRLGGHLYLARRSGRITLPLAANQMLPLLVLHLQVAPVLPPPPAPDDLAPWTAKMRALGWQPKRSVFVVHGRVFPVPTPTHEEAFNTWVDAQPSAVRTALRSWFALDFSATHAYCIELPTAPLHGRLRVIDFGRKPF